METARMRRLKDWSLAKKDPANRRGLCFDSNPPQEEIDEVYKRIAAVRDSWSEDERYRRQVVKPTDWSVESIMHRGFMGQGTAVQDMD